MQLILVVAVLISLRFEYSIGGDLMGQRHTQKDNGSHPSGALGGQVNVVSNVASHSFYPKDLKDHTIWTRCTKTREMEESERNSEAPSISVLLDNNGTTVRNQSELIWSDAKKNTTAKSCEMLKNIYIAGKSMDLLFAQITCRRESIIRTNITEAYTRGAEQLSVNYIYNRVYRLLSEEYCIFSKRFAYVLDALKEERSQNPQAAKKFKVVFSGLYKKSKNMKQRIDCFFQIWKQMMNTMFGTGRDAKKTIAAAAPLLKARAHGSGNKIARMVFRAFQELGDAVQDAAVEIANIKKAAEAVRSATNGHSIE